VATKKKPRPLDGDQTAIVEPTVRVFTTWTPALIRQAEMAADNGNLRPAANLCDWLLADDRIRAVLDSRVKTLLGLEPQFEKAGDRRRSGRAVKALEVGEDWWVSYPESTSWLLIAWGLLLGIGPAQHAWTSPDGHGGRIMPSPEFWHPQHLRYDTLLRKWFTRTGDLGTEIEFTPGDGTWVAHMPYGTHRPWSMGLWRGLARWALLKTYAIQDWAKHSEKASLLVARYDGNQASTKSVRAELASDLNGRGSSAVAVLPDNFDIKLVESVANTKNLYEAQIYMADKAIAIAVRGGNLTTDTEGGSKAAAEVQERTGDFVNLRFDAETFSSTIHDQSLTWWAEFNFGDSKLAPWPNYPVAPQRNLKQFAESVTAAVEALTAAEARGLDVDRQAFIEEFELQEFMGPGKKPEPVAPAAPAADSAKPAESKPADEPNTTPDPPEKP
jgi:hypothetical protein